MSKQTVSTAAPVAPPPAEDTTAVVKVETGGEVGFPIDFAADAGAGTAFAGSDLSIPFLQILQKNSPQCDDAHGKYVEGAKAGVIYNTVTGELFDGRTKGIVVVCAGYAKKYVEWVERDAGGGFVGQHDPESDAVRACRVNDKGKLVTPSGHQMVETAYHYVVLVDDQGNPHWAVISMSSTQLKKSRKWNTLIAGTTMRKPTGESFKPPIFAQQYRLKTVVEQKDQNTWYGWDVATIGAVDSRAIYDSAKSYHAALMSGAIRVANPPQSDDSVPDADTPF